ncbi:uncharacterized protein PHACADRAFT_142728 [Phanerochaete carnosa HHB-10118-sp]|uniref:Transmembrane protein n=1 Tax=Phanerochaete carnosa (strain HHB-10118-sp) TaxID=650164 RepID=K5UXW6_PHACS|nr:uncharacterized protein PHACADRAFT_142728 [Phanerochaete carnosa HHB-10118-sp]EKM54941.1 hypothetical protein PHACADRAFT_142728 [Phanerochaete carnosa HHB-10118-sp]
MHKLERYHYQRDMILCFSLHVLHVLIHAALFVVISHHYEHAITIHFDSSTTTWAPLFVGTILQIFATGYNAILVLLTQRRALRNDLSARQTLTAVHNKASAWLGLESALESLWQQTKLSAAAWGVSCITLYLLCVFALHISIQGFFHVVLYTATMPTLQLTNLTNANYTANMVPAYDVLLAYGQIQKVALLDNMVYDIIPQIPSATGNTMVNASVYNVQCMVLLNIQPDNMIEDTSIPTVYYVMDGPDSAEIGLKLLCIRDCWAPIIIGTTVSVADSSGAGVPTLTGNPGSPPHSSRCKPSEQTLQATARKVILMTAVQVVTCAVEINDKQINISATTRQPLASPPEPSEAFWTTFSWPDNLTPTDSRLIAAQNALILSPSSGHGNDAFLNFANPSNTITNVTAAGLIVSSAHNNSLPINSDSFDNVSISLTQLPTAFNMWVCFCVFVAEELGIVAHNRTNITLTDLNHSIGKALAAVHWYGLYQRLNPM